MNELYDIIIVGCGPAGISAAINGKIRNKNVLLLGAELCSPKLHKTPIIHNYPALPGIRGEDLRQALIRHAESMEIPTKNKKVVEISPLEKEFHIMCGDEIFNSKTCILATGVSYTGVLSGEQEFLGKGVSYCATSSALLYHNKNIAVLSYTSEGEKDAEFLSEICNNIYYIPAYNMENEINSKIRVVNDIPVKISGRNHVNSLELKNTTLDIDGIFILKESLPFEKLVSGIETDTSHIKVNRLMETSIPGLFAAGDCAGKPYHLAKAVGEGQIAALTAVNFIDYNKIKKFQGI